MLRHTREYRTHILIGLCVKVQLLASSKLGWFEDGILLNWFCWPLQELVRTRLENKRFMVSEILMCKSSDSQCFWLTQSVKLKVPCVCRVLGRRRQGHLVWAVVRAGRYMHRSEVQRVGDPYGCAQSPVRPRRRQDQVLDIPWRSRSCRLQVCSTCQVQPAANLFGIALPFRVRH